MKTKTTQIFNIHTDETSNATLFDVDWRMMEETKEWESSRNDIFHRQ
jgi:hypothetical protein